MRVTLYLRHASEADLERFIRWGVTDADLGVEDDAKAALERLARLRDLELLYVADEGRAAFSPAAREMLYGHLDLMRRRGCGAKPVGTPQSPVLDLQESWRMLHFLFTGDAWEGELPAATLLIGGREVGEDLGYGPPRAVPADQAASFARFLGALDLGVLAARLDGKAMKALGIYCEQDKDSQADLRDDLLRYFPRLQTFVGDAAARRRGLLIWML